MSDPKKNGGGAKGGPAPEAKKEEPKPASSPAPAAGATAATPPPAAGGASLAKAEGGPAALAPKLDAAAFEEDAKDNPRFGREDLAIPRLVILQTMSPQCDKAKPEFVKGAEAGMVYDTVNGVLLNRTVTKDGKEVQEGIEVVVAHYRRTHIEWRTRNDGGGFVADLGADDACLKRTTRDEKTGASLTPEGTEVVPTAEYVLLLLLASGAAMPVVTSMSKTQMKKAKRWNTLMAQLALPRASGQGSFNPPTFYSVWRLTTVPESNEKGSWFNWEVARVGNLTERGGGEALYHQARDLRKLVDAGAVKLAPPTGGGEADPTDPAAPF